MSRWTDFQRRANAALDRVDWTRVRNWLGLLLTIWIVVAIGWTLNRVVPNEHLPWRPLDPERPIGMATKGQLLRLSVSPSEVCMSMAREIADFETIPSDPREAPDPCGWDVARLVYAAGEARLTPGEANMQCPLAIASYIWLREVGDLAEERYGQSLARVHHMGSFSCRRQRGNGSGRWSEHAFANAWDVAAFELEDGRLIQLLRDWDGDDAEAAFLRDARDQACRVFNVTLSPDYNAAHADHFHVDMGPYSSCR